MIGRMGIGGKGERRREGGEEDGGGWKDGHGRTGRRQEDGVATYTSLK